MCGLDVQANRVDSSCEFCIIVLAFLHSIDCELGCAKRSRALGTRNKTREAVVYHCVLFCCCLGAS